MESLFNREALIYWPYLKAIRILFMAIVRNRSMFTWKFIKVKIDFIFNLN
jgi:hypothetical protein